MFGRPWEQTQGAVPWEPSPFSRTVSIHRARTVAGSADSIGSVGYSGREAATTLLDPQGEVVVLSELPATVQVKSPGRARGGIIPSDIVEKPIWVIIIPASTIAQYSVRDRDIVVDDEGYRYGVATAEWTPLGYTLMCIRLEA